MIDAEQRYVDAITDIAKKDLAAALQLATGTFVSLLLAVMDLYGHDTDKEIKVDGGENRDITVHAPKRLSAAGSPLREGGE